MATEASAQTEERQDGNDDDNGADQPNEIGHDAVPSKGMKADLNGTEPVLLMEAWVPTCCS